jgi:pantetheine-phosphate adenylyltransferase
LVAFEKIIVAVLSNDKKAPLFSVAERMEMIRESAAEMGADPGRIEVDRFDGLLVNYAQERGARVILRGLRAVADFEYELQMANMNRHLNDDVETVFIMANDAYFYVASNLVKEVARLGGNVADLVPAPVLPRLLAKFDK